MSNNKTYFCWIIIFYKREGKMKIGIIFGGSSVEHDISVITAYQIYASIDKEKYKRKIHRSS